MHLYSHEPDNPVLKMNEVVSLLPPYSDPYIGSCHWFQPTGDEIQRAAARKLGFWQGMTDCGYNYEGVEIEHLMMSMIYELIPGVWDE